MAIVKLLALLGIFLAPLIGVQAQTLTCAEGDLWFFSEDTWLIWLTPLEDKACLWGTPDDANSLQRPGRCGWEAEHNRFAVLTHNWYCDANNCPTGVGGVSDIPLLDVGERVQLCEYGKLWQGRVVSSERVTTGHPQPQTDFECGADVCGTIVTSVGPRAGRYGPAEGYWLVRMAYR